MARSSRLGVLACWQGHPLLLRDFPLRSLWISEDVRKAQDDGYLVLPLDTLGLHVDTLLVEVHGEDVSLSCWPHAAVAIEAPHEAGRQPFVEETPYRKSQLPRALRLLPGHSARITVGALSLLLTFHDEPLFGRTGGPPPARLLAALALAFVAHAAPLLVASRQPEIPREQGGATVEDLVTRQQLLRAAHDRELDLEDEAEREQREEELAPDRGSSGRLQTLQQFSRGLGRTFDWDGARRAGTPWWWTEEGVQEQLLLLHPEQPRNRTYDGLWWPWWGAPSTTEEALFLRGIGEYFHRESWLGDEPDPPRWRTARVTPWVDVRIEGVRTQGALETSLARLGLARLAPRFAYCGSWETPGTPRLFSSALWVDQRGRPSHVHVLGSEPGGEPTARCLAGVLREARDLPAAQGIATLSFIVRFPSP
jgi:hypothetical protein